MSGLEGKLKDYWANITETICTHISIKELDKIWHNFRLVSVAQWNLQYSCLTWHWNLLSYVPWLSSINDITGHRCFFVQQITSVMPKLWIGGDPLGFLSTFFWFLKVDFSLGIFSGEPKTRMEATFNEEETFPRKQCYFTNLGNALWNAAMVSTGVRAWLPRFKDSTAIESFIAESIMATT